MGANGWGRAWQASGHAEPYLQRGSLRPSDLNAALVSGETEAAEGVRQPARPLPSKISGCARPISQRRFREGSSLVFTLLLLTFLFIFGSAGSCCPGFPSCGVRLLLWKQALGGGLQVAARLAPRLWSTGSVAVAQGFSCSEARDLSGSRIEPVSPGFADGLGTTEP